ncbi:hypothetical protein BO70DRAFT_51004 [Aspergillus heteromorphus CBS 117.55]|uniref:BZIP domain-containing protein n=1 Tax=Aspergillus heteromorphus CBS 117.55 TaxID=1448321 RepID=A0A317W611_9EURO|nr:uncharacterized protein BO70DRAFT_51004 [Aspergillus heteromorphus CBS 117.55]PWY79590.1 hypothetical protein BO70DRAFT_51004 [Aspergillus heteromorphus CBS 117.55]
MATPAPVLAMAPGPAPLAPALAAKPTISPSPGPGTPGSVTSKEWVIPPRPKPGRKPATDTPPTKRKAQNRAAQRAFRERRAARVNELEDQIKQIEDEHDLHVATFKEQISSLSHEVDQCRSEMAWWRDRCHALEKEVSVERSAKESLVKEFRSSLTDSNNNNNSNNNHPDKAPVTRVPARTPAVPEHHEDPDDVPLGCTNCSTGHCQCIEDAFGMPGIESSHSKRPAHPEPEIKPEPEEMEIDFTTRFAAPALPPQHHRLQDDSVSVTAMSSPAVDPCGFCQDGTPCICAEMAAQEEERRRNSFENNRLAPIQNLSQFTPPPSDGDVRSEVTLPPISQATAANPCANGPGTCAQCVADPRRTLFCKTLAAASRSASAASSSGGASGGGGCCGGKGADGGCCMSQKQAPPPPPPKRKSASPSLTLSCADAFTTLSRHPNFSRASDDISSWLPKLHTLPDPNQRDIPQPGSRAALEVEAASVMGVLRYFDRRFADK